MEYQDINNKFESLPAEAKKQVIAFIDFLQDKYSIKNRKKTVKNNLQNDKFYGMWKDRKDIKDSVGWVREIRKKEWES